MNTLLRRSAAFASALLFALTGMVPTVAAQPMLVVVPNELAMVEGNDFNSYPFSLAGNFTSQRYQQVYAASDFAPLAGPHRITQIAFRPDAENGRAFATTISNIEIRLSTTPRGPNDLSAVFANNVGADDTVVFAGALSLSSAFTGPEAGPKDFDIVIHLQTPFTYDPTAGNLLLDVRAFTTSRTTFFDAHKSDDAVARGYSVFGGTETVNDPIGVTDTSGLVTRFTLTPVAHPPQSKNDCKQGRWHTHTRADGSRFKNQGDCIQYVNTGT